MILKAAHSLGRKEWKAEETKPQMDVNFKDLTICIVLTSVDVPRII
jgi:hypothetical protein